MQSLANLVERIREAVGPGFAVPHFDPLDGGLDARVLFLLEAPGAKAVYSGFVSRNNPDETAKNFFELNASAGIGRGQTIIWNVVPWYIGTGIKIRAARREDVRLADPWLAELLRLLVSLRFVVYVGQKALLAKGVVERTRPDVGVLSMPHPSPLFVNHAPNNRARLLDILRQLAVQLAATDA
jgi:uracil-DNA glycosylase